MNSSIALQSSKTQTGSRVGWGGPGGRAVGSVGGGGGGGGGSLGINLAWTQMIQRLFDEKSHLVGWLVGWLALFYFLRFESEVREEGEILRLQQISCI